jgi:hypothetical protein
LLRPCFARVEPWLQVRKYAAALMSQIPRRNGWTIAEHAGDRAPDKTQRLLVHGIGEQEQADTLTRCSEPLYHALDRWAASADPAGTVAIERGSLTPGRPLAASSEKSSAGIPAISVTSPRPSGAGRPPS